MESRSRDILKLMNQILEIRHESLDLEQELCLELATVAREAENSYGEAFAYVYLVDCSLLQNDSLVCVDYLRKAKLLCKEHGYYDLLLPLYNFSGLYYSRMGDEQTALSNYLEGLDMSRIQGDYIMECLILNNIGVGFQKRGEYAFAKTYFKMALKVLMTYETEEDAFSYAIFLCNLAEVSQMLGQLQDSEKYLMMCEAMESKSVYERYRMYAGWCGHYVAASDSEQCMKYADIMKRHHLESFEDRHFAFDMLLTMSRYMLDIGNREYAGFFLESSVKVMVETDLESCYQLQELKVRYSQKYGTRGEQSLAYRQYYELTEKMERINDKVRTEGMVSKINLFEAIEERESIYKENKRLMDAGHLDEITGIYNRRYFNKQVLKIFDRSCPGTVGVIMLDVDYFKEYNDCYGHNKGDEVLFSVAKCMKDCADSRICPGRYGGDEFICLCTDMTDEEVEAYVLHVRECLYRKKIPHQASLCSDRVTLSIGYCNEPVTDISEADSWMELADQALYRVKRKGRNGYCRNKRLESS